MPPFIPDKRRLSSPPPDLPTAKTYKKASLFDTVDKPAISASLQDNKTFLNQLNGSESETSLSEIDSVGFEDTLPLPSSKKRKLSNGEEDDGEIDWEDAVNPDPASSVAVVIGNSGDLELTLDKSARIGSFANPHAIRKGPSKIERQIRVSAHCMHVQFLLFHNLIRNGWACDMEIQQILVEHLPLDVRKEVEKWKVESGLSPEANLSLSKKTQYAKGRRKRKGAESKRNQRDWGQPAERQEKGAPNMSRGDPLIRLLKVLVAYWRKHFTVTAPGLRKQGYRSIAALEEHVTSYRNTKHDAEEHGECIQGLPEFRALAKKCEGSRDVGAQLFTALLRGLGLEARQVASLQPVGFGWSKNEEAFDQQKKDWKTSNHSDSDTVLQCDEGSNSDTVPASTIGKPKPTASSSHTPSARGLFKQQGLSIGTKTASINISEDDGSMDDDESVVDVTPSTPGKRPNTNYDRDMAFPTYWTEVVSPITNEVCSVDPLILTPAVAVTSDQFVLFESRGVKADKAKQVFAYIVAYSADGTAKDVTTRYLKRHVWPGRTKGVRLPIEKVPIYNKRGKIKRYEHYDWFKSVISGYSRTNSKRTVADDIEEAKDLKVAKREKEAKANDETLQGYKTSADFVLERHLRREEAILPGSEPVKTFTIGKGERSREEPVFLRKDIEVCRTSESWHKEGRTVKPGEHPLKMVPVRAVTLTRKREVEEAQRDGGEKLRQGLYGWDQTDWIIPPPIENGVIPKNAFGNMDCYVPTMIPRGAVHLPLKSTAKICKRLAIDFAEAVTGFEFGAQRAVPVITGVVVAEEHELVVINEWKKDEERRKIKEEGKREKIALGTWKKWLMGLRIVQRVREEYGGDAGAQMKEEMNPFTNQNKDKITSQVIAQADAAVTGRNDGGIDKDATSFASGHDADGGGGFFLEEDERGDIYEGKRELTLEVEKHTAEPDSMSDVSPLSIASAATAEQPDGVEHEPADHGNELGKQQKKKNEAIVNGRLLGGVRARSGDASTDKKPPFNGRKRNEPVSFEHSNSAEAIDKSDNHVPPKSATRSAPKRKAARKGEV